MTSYERDGFLALPQRLSSTEMVILNREWRVVAEREAPDSVFESDGRTMRGRHGCHRDSSMFTKLTRLPRLLIPAAQLLGTPVYVYQFKVNCKAAFTGEAWRWHQDFIYWREEDGMLAPRAVNVALFMDDVTEFNGPIMLIPGSHKQGVIEAAVTAPSVQSLDVAWKETVSLDLKYTLRAEVVTQLSRNAPIVAPKGPAGTVLLFHPNVAHGSVQNLSPDSRNIVMITYNSVDNLPIAHGPRRPEFLVGRDSRPLTPVSDEALERSVAVDVGMTSLSDCVGSARDDSERGTKSANCLGEKDVESI